MVQQIENVYYGNDGSYDVWAMVLHLAIYGGDDTDLL